VLYSVNQEGVQVRHPGVVGALAASREFAASAWAVRSELAKRRGSDVAMNTEVRDLDKPER